MEEAPTHFFGLHVTLTICVATNVTPALISSAAQPRFSENRPIEIRAKGKPWLASPGNKELQHRIGTQGAFLATQTRHRDAPGLLFLYLVASSSGAHFGYLISTGTRTRLTYISSLSRPGTLLKYS